MVSHESDPIRTHAFERASGRTPHMCSEDDARKMSSKTRSNATFIESADVMTT
jgi:hypothetical protein